MTSTLYMKIYLNEDPRYNIMSCACIYDSNWDTVEICYLHPLTNQKCEDIDQCFYGWCEQDYDEDTKWEKLRLKIREAEEKGIIRDNILSENPELAMI